MQGLILMAALAVFLPVQEPAKSAAHAAQLTEPGEQSANAVQPPEQSATTRIAGGS